MADQEISAFTPAGTLDGSEMVPVVKAGNKKTTTGAIADFANKSEVPEYENNTAALNGGLVPNDRYHLPIENDRYILAIVRPAPPTPELLMKITTNDDGGSLPWANQAAFEAAMAATNPDLEVTNYSLEFGVLSIMGFNIIDLPSGAFANNLSITEFEGPKIKTIGASAFFGCESLGVVLMPELEIIGSNGFQHNVSLTEANFPGVIEIGHLAFDQCSALSVVNIPLAESIGNMAFNECTSISTLSFPNVTIVETSAFRLSSLTDISFPLATDIGNEAFIDCGNLFNIFLPSATSIGTNAFQLDSAAWLSVTITIPTAMELNAAVVYAESQGATIVTV